MSNEVLSSLAEAQAVFQKHADERKNEGWGSKPDAWVSICKTRFVVVVNAYRGELLSVRPYEYELGFACAGIHEIIPPKKAERPGNGKKKAEHEPRPKRPLRQLHMFKPG